jgi:hypothetical protein
MTTDGLIALAGIALAIYALANPVQRRSVNLLVGWWPVGLAFGAALACAGLADVLSAIGCALPGWLRIGASDLALVLALGGIAWALASWQRLSPPSRACSLRRVMFEPIRHVRTEASPVSFDHQKTHEPPAVCARVRAGYLSAGGWVLVGP